MDATKTSYILLSLQVPTCATAQAAPDPKVQRMTCKLTSSDANIRQDRARDSRCQGLSLNGERTARDWFTLDH